MTVNNSVWNTQLSTIVVVALGIVLGANTPESRALKKGRTAYAIPSSACNWGGPADDSTANWGMFSINNVVAATNARTFVYCPVVAMRGTNSDGMRFGFGSSEIDSVRIIYHKGSSVEAVPTNSPGGQVVHSSGSALDYAYCSWSTAGTLSDGYYGATTTACSPSNSIYPYSSVHVKLAFSSALPGDPDDPTNVESVYLALSHVQVKGKL